MERLKELDSELCNEIFELVNKKKLDSNSKQRLIELGKLALSLNEFFHALKVFIRLGDKKTVRIIGRQCVENEWLFDASVAFRYTRNKKSLFNIIKICENRGEYVKDLACDYLGEDLRDHAYNKFQKWISKKGFSYAIFFHPANIVKMAYELSNKYDIGIGIAKGGLCLTWVFNLFGLKTKVVEAHRKGIGATFRYVDRISLEDIRDKKVVIFDKDIVTGRTTRRIIRELKRFKPKSLDLILFHDPVNVKGGFGSYLPSVSEQFNNVYYPKKLMYTNFDKAVKQFGSVLGA